MSSSLDLFNVEAESQLLAGLLRNAEAYWDINNCHLTASDFMGPENKRVMKAIEAVVDGKKVPEFALVLEEVRANGRDSTVEYLSGLQRVPCSVPQAKEFASTVKGLSASRQLVTAGARIIELANEKRADAGAALAEAESELRKVRSTVPEETVSPHPADIFREMRESDPGDVLPLYFAPTLTEKTEGLHRGHLWVVGGFSSTGKSAVAVNMAVDVLRQPGQWVGVISTEMTRAQYLLRMLSLITGVPQKHIRQRVQLPFMDAEAMADAEKFLSRAPLRVYDNKYRLADIRSTLIRMSETDGLRVAFIDYLQQVRAPGESEYSQMTNAINELQETAKQLGITIVTFSQLSNSMARDLNDPNTSKEFYAFKGSGAIKDAADVAVILKRDKHTSPGTLDWQVQKVRHGEAPFTIETRMHLLTGRIEEVGLAEYDEFEGAA